MVVTLAHSVPVLLPARAQRRWRDGMVGFAIIKLRDRLLSAGLQGGIDWQRLGMVSVSVALVFGMLVDLGAHPHLPEHGCPSMTRQALIALPLRLVFAVCVGRGVGLRPFEGFLGPGELALVHVDVGRDLAHL